MLLRADNAYGLQMSKFWQRVSTWVEAIRKSGHIDACIIIDTQNFNTAMLKSSLFGEISMRGFDGSNLTGVFRISQLPTTILLLFLQGNKTCGLPTPIEWRMEGTVLQNGTNALVFTVKIHQCCKRQELVIQTPMKMRVSPP